MVSAWSSAISASALAGDEKGGWDASQMRWGRTAVRRVEVRRHDHQLQGRHPRFPYPAVGSVKHLNTEHPDGREIEAAAKCGSLHFWRR